MKYTNKLGLPAPIANAVMRDPYTKGTADFSVTELLGPARIRQLEIRHYDELTEDVSDRIFSLLGQSIHSILERSCADGVSERRLSITVDDATISGQMDYYLDGVLVDYKTTSSHQFQGVGLKEEYVQQLNIYAEILRQNGHPVKSLQICAVLRDWSRTQAMREPNYPQQGVVLREAPVWSSEECMSFIRARIKAHRDAEKELPLCSAAERWERPGVHAVMKEGRKSALKLYPADVPGSDTDAKRLADSTPGCSVVFRPGTSPRCEMYCPVSQFCSVYQSTKKGESSNEV